MSERSSYPSRRRVLRGTGAFAAISLAGCLGDEEQEDDTSDQNGGNSGGDTEEETNDSSDFPSEPMEWIIPWSEGGGTDSTARGVAPGVSEVLDVDITINNVPAAGGLEAIGQIYTAEPDGYTISAANPPAIPATVLAREPDYFEDPMDLLELEGVASAARTPYALGADAELDVSGLDDLVTRFEEGDLRTIGGSGGAAPFYLALRDVVGLEAEDFIVYGGTGDAARAAAAGEVDCAIGAESGIQGTAKEGLVDPIFSFHSDGSHIFDIPSIAEVENIDWMSQTIRVYKAPPGTPQDRVDTIAEGFKEGIQTDTVQQWVEDTGNPLEYWGPERVENEYEEIMSGVQENLDIGDLRDLFGE